MAVPIIKQAITSAPREADVTVSPECHPSRELICAEEPREELLAIAPVSEAEFIEDDVEYYSDGMEFESASVSIINPMSWTISFIASRPATLPLRLPLSRLKKSEIS
jgi:hypothetical protein